MHTMTLVYVLFTLFIGHNDGSEQQGAQVSSALIAKEFVEQLSKRNYAECVAHFDSTVGSLMPASKVKEMWDKIVEHSGAFKSQLAVRTQKYKIYDMVFVTCQFERDTLDMKLVFDPAGKIAGLFFVPAKAVPEYQPPPYVKRESFREEEMTIGSGQWALPGTLTLPAGPGPFRALVLVHGSGANDRDETIGPNKPFRDLAWGLATRGVAVLRYEKRTREHAAELLATKNTMTVKEETIDDAITALSLLRKTNGIDSNRVYVLGHSLGATLIPRIGQLDQRISGFILLAGAARRLEDLIVEQYSYIFSLDSGNIEGKKKVLDEMKHQAEGIRSLKRSDSTSSGSLLMFPVSYWLDLQGYNPAEVAKTLTRPMLVLQGGRDYQVTMNDFERWEASLGTKKSVHLKMYPQLNHLFIEGIGKSTPLEYETPGHVAAYVVEDIADWIKK